MDKSHVSWRKASYSRQDSNCVEVSVSREPSATAFCLVRDSKNPTGPSLAFSATGWHTFITVVKAGAFPHVL